MKLFVQSKYIGQIILKARRNKTNSECAGSLTKNIGYHVEPTKKMF